MASSNPVWGLTRAKAFICDACLARSRWTSVASASATRGLSTKTAAGRIAARIRFSGEARQTTMNASGFSRHQSLSSRRMYSTTTPALPLQPASSGLMPLPDRRLISLSGPDAAKFLQGLVTNDVRASPNHTGALANQGFYSAFLDARGRVLWDVFIYETEEVTKEAGQYSYHIEVDAGEVEVLARHLKRHKLRSKITIEIVKEGDIAVWAGWDVPVGLEEDGRKYQVAVKDTRSHDMGYRFLTKHDDPPVRIQGQDVTTDMRQYHIRRYLRGVSEGPLEIPRESALPMECNIDLADGIDFKKGCYVGQELTIRTKHTGVVRKRTLPVQLYTSETPPEQKHPLYESSFPLDLIPANGAEIKQLDEAGNIKKGRPAGKFIAAIGNVGLALVRLEMMTSMRVSAEGGPWKPGVQFGVQKEDGEVVKVKAFAPQWFREKERELWDKNRKRLFGQREKEAVKEDEIL